jgi:hypothetical protein
MCFPRCTICKRVRQKISLKKNPTVEILILRVSGSAGVLPIPILPTLIFYWMQSFLLCEVEVHPYPQEDAIALITLNCVRAMAGKNVDAHSFIQQHGKIPRT